MRYLLSPHFWGSPVPLIVFDEAAETGGETLTLEQQQGQNDKIESSR
jgi:hypothetical protein